MQDVKAACTAHTTIHLTGCSHLARPWRVNNALQRIFSTDTTLAVALQLAHAYKSWL